MDGRQSAVSLITLQSTPLNILDLNDDVLEEMFSYLPFDDLVKIRLVVKQFLKKYNLQSFLKTSVYFQVCRRFNSVSQILLNKGFTAVRLYVTECRNKITAQLPRRASERSIHPLYQHVKVLSSNNNKSIAIMIYFICLFVMFIYVIFT